MILNIVFWLMLVSNLKKMPSLKCSNIWSSIPNVVEFVVTWDSGWKVNLMTLAIVLMVIILRKWDLVQNFGTFYCPFKEHNSSNTTMHTWSISLFNLSSIISMFFLAHFQVIDGKPSKVYLIRLNNVIMEILYKRLNEILYFKALKKTHNIKL